MNTIKNWMFLFFSPKDWQPPTHSRVITETDEINLFDPTGANQKADK